ncbi:MAG: riboflavin synthase [Vibrionaceae bacterium]
MFTGIIEAVGHIEAIVSKSEDVTLRINSGSLDLADVKLGDSIATNGVCLTVVSLTGKGFCADLSKETLQSSAFSSYGVGKRVNLEKAMLATTRFGGHIVSGHVDGVARVLSVTHVGRALEYWLEAPSALARYLAVKGSVTIDGISLTINAVEENRFKLTIVPHTQTKTTLVEYVGGSQVNLEVDVVARYLERLLHAPAASAATPEPAAGVSMEKLAACGFLKR